MITEMIPCIVLYSQALKIDWCIFHKLSQLSQPKIPQNSQFLPGPTIGVPAGAAIMEHSRDCSGSMQ